MRCSSCLDDGVRNHPDGREFCSCSVGQGLFDRAACALCERLLTYADDPHCVAVNMNLASDLREAEALISLLRTPR
jgi:hypothetical protein